MTVSEHLMRPGNGSISFRDDLPLSVSNAIMAAVDEDTGGTGAHLVITRVPVEPAATGDTAAIAASIYTGRVVRRPTRTSLEFVGLGSWLDTYIDSELSRTGGTPTQWLGDLLANGLTVGAVAGGSNVDRTLPAHIATRRECLDQIAGLGGWEYRINPDFTVDAGTGLFVSPPDVVVTRKAEGPDVALRGVDGAMLDQTIDTSTTATKAVALASGSGSSIVKGSATAAVNLLTWDGNTPELVTVMSAPSEEDANADTAAQGFLDLQGLRREVRVSSSTHHLPASVQPGDEVGVFDVASGLVDASNPVEFRGEAIFPATVRLLSITWPIEQGYGVYVRTNSVTPTWIDVTPWVAWETGDTSWTVGDWAPAGYGRTNRSNPEIEQRIGTAPDWQSITLADANWDSVRTLEWRREGGRVFLRGRARRITSNLSPGNAMFGWGSSWSGNPPEPSAVAEFPLFSLVSAHDVTGGWVADPATSFQTSGVSTVAIGTYVYLDDIDYPI